MIYTQKTRSPSDCGRRGCEVSCLSSFGGEDHKLENALNGKAM